MDLIVHYVVDRLNILGKAPDVFALAVIAAGMLIYGAVHFLFRTRLETKDGIIDGLKETLARRDESLTECKALLADLRTEQAAEIADRPEPPAPVIETIVPEPSSSAGVRRDTTVSEALAYAQFHEWGLRFLDAAGMEGNDVTNLLDRITQLAADGEISMWGKRDAIGVWEPIEAGHWINYRVEWFGLLRGAAHSEARRHRVSVGGFSDLMTSRAQVEKLFQPPSTPHMRMLKALAPSLQILRARIDEARDRIEEMDASSEQVARIRQTMSSLALSDDPIWGSPAMAQARTDLLTIWEKLFGIVERMRRGSLSSDQLNYFRSEIERSETLLFLNDAVKRLNAGFAGEDIPEAGRFGKSE